MLLVQLSSFQVIKMFILNIKLLKSDFTKILNMCILYTYIGFNVYYARSVLLIYYIIYYILIRINLYNFKNRIFNNSIIEKKEVIILDKSLCIICERQMRRVMNNETVNHGAQEA